MTREQLRVRVVAIAVALAFGLGVLAGVLATPSVVRQTTLYCSDVELAEETRRLAFETLFR